MNIRKQLLLVCGDGERGAEHGRMLAMLGETFAAAPEAEATRALEDADILLVDGSVQAMPRLVDEVRRAQPRLPVIALLRPDALEQASHLLGFDEVELLVAPCEPADYAAALAAARLRSGRVSAAAEDAARRLLELSEEVARIARAMAMSTARAPRMPSLQAEDVAVEARAFRAMIGARRLREEHLPAELFGEPAWDMLLDLTAARLEGRSVSVTDLTIAAAVPPTTALRYIKTMIQWGLLSRRPDNYDGRRVFLDLCDDAFDRMCAWFVAARKVGLNV